jgi:ABC-2 type transport system ATP-binding protein
VVLSSHILSDVQRVADQVGVLRAGRLVYQGPLPSLLDRYLRPTWRLRLRGPVAALRDALSAADWVEAVDDLGGGTLLVRTRSLDDGERGLVAAAAAVDARVVAMVPEEADLESAFLALTEQEGSA